MIKLAVLGATGRMGECTLALAGSDGRFQVTAALTRSDDPRLGEQVLIGHSAVKVSDTTNAAFDVLVDFSMPAGTMQWLDHCRSTGSAMVVGPTGYSDEQLDRITAAAKRIPILRASNFSIGINLLLDLAGKVAGRLGDTFDIEIVEHHHKHKIDAPSGTALALANAIVEATGRDPQRDISCGRQGRTGPRPPRQIGVHSVRMGSIVGRHEVNFSSLEETITLTHTAHSRNAFARGALEAAVWIHGQVPGMYQMGDVLSARPSARH